MERVFYGQLYTFLVLIKWDQVTPFVLLNFDVVSCWAQLHGLNPRHLSEALGYEFFPDVDVVFPCPQAKSVMIVRDYLRGFILLDLTRPAEVGFLRETTHGDVMAVIAKYEQLRIICYKCGRVGHRLSSF